MRLRLTSRRGRLAAFFLLYLSEGIPFGFTAVTMTAYLRRHGVGLEAIGLFTASLYAPWGFKWAWAPLVDLVRFERFGTSRAWIVFAQSMMIVTIGVVLFFDPALQLGLVTSLIIVHNVFAATQDIAIDALAVRVLPQNELGTANGLMFSAAYLGQAIGGSGALFIAGKLGYDAAFLFMLVSLTVLLFAVSLPLLEPPIVALALAAPRARSTGRRQEHRLGDLPPGVRSHRLLPARALHQLLSLRPRTADRRRARDPAAGSGRARTGARHHHSDRPRHERGARRGAFVSHLGRRRARLRGRRLGVRSRRPPQVARGLVRPDRGAGVVPRLAIRRWPGWPGRPGRRRRRRPGLYTAVAVVFSVASGLQYGTGNAVFMALSSKTVAATQFTGYMALKNLALSYSSLWQGRVASVHGYSRTLLLDGLIAIVPILVLPFVGPAAVATRRRPRAPCRPPPPPGAPSGRPEPRLGGPALGR